ncbi:MAG: M20 family metallo-hydrolase [Bacteroidetes bacterium]|nr:M20 family metallo-hydrolase [Bacteroidota bacterium]
MEYIDTYEKEAIQLLKSLIETPSFSSEETHTAKLIEAWFEQKGISNQQIGHNRYAFNKHFDPKKPSLLLNSHHDTVKPNSAYTLDPFKAIEKDGKIYGLGSNDAGGCLVCLLSTFAHFYERKDLKYNLIIVASAEEESSGPNGLNSVLPLLPKIDMAIVGEPTQMHLAIAEKGLVVFDGVIKGTPSHAAHPNSDQAIYKTAGVLNWFETYSFEKVSDFLGPVKMTVTQIAAGSQHNVIPGEVKLVVDVRVNDCYSNAEINELLQRDAPLELKARSLRLGSSSVRPDHPLVIAGKSMGRETYGSPTLSDQATILGPSLKLGPGDSTRSHTADEFIYRAEIVQGIEIYCSLLETYLTQ